MKPAKKVEALAQDTAFIEALAACQTAEEAQNLFDSRGIHLSGEQLLESRLMLLNCNAESALLSDEALTQVASGKFVFQPGKEPRPDSCLLGGNDVTNIL